jgi:hypothetical protein
MALIFASLIRRRLVQLGRLAARYELAGQPAVYLANELVFACHGTAARRYDSPLNRTDLEMPRLRGIVETCGSTCPAGIIV